jgi:hypothetical protein
MGSKFGSRADWRSENSIAGVKQVRDAEPSFLISELQKWIGTNFFAGGENET